MNDEAFKSAMAMGTAWCLTVYAKQSCDFLPLDVEKVIFHEKNTTVFLTDGRKGTSYAIESDEFDEFTGFVIAYYKAKNKKVFALKEVLRNCVESAKKKGYKQAILKNYK